MNDSNDYWRGMAEHRARLIDLGEGLVRELNAIDHRHSFTLRYDDDHEAAVYLDRSDGLKLGLYWYCGTNDRPSLAPVVPRIPGRYRSEYKSGLSASFNPDRPVTKVARDMLRRVVLPWEQQLPAIVTKQDKTLGDRQSTEMRAAAIARRMGVRLREDAPRLIADDEQVPIGIGGFREGFEVEVKVSSYKEGVTFKIELEVNQELAQEWAEQLRRQYLEHLEKTGLTLCPHCTTRAADSSGLCLACQRA